MAEKLKIISLGGLNEIGKNLTVYEYGGDIIVVDVGMGFPDDDMYGIDVVIPDFTYLIKNQDKIRGIFLTHGHEDHIGSIPYLLRSVNAPIYATRMTAGLVKLKLEEHRLLDKTKLITCEAGEVVKAGKFSPASSLPPSPPMWTASSRSYPSRQSTAARWPLQAAVWRMPCGSPPSWAI